MNAICLPGHKPNNKRKYKGKRQAHAEKLVAFNTKEWKEGDEILDILLKRCGNAKKCALSSKVGSATCTSVFQSIN